ncbi:DUF1800 domain-containing protein [Wenzhouxiangella sp. XN79A]|uniref:DUF1800 domain-containing protein n=1 Tax=Wenzhouxiangella sp. XN79A TaxID=2724193 RepID=UPI00144A6307|nr:DUF1800 domain-containing protein [Wenzhouxiangella sp. XN79A]NKI36361.1 DUF1800 domain-containing protein [Wenzhouxiangella sp. XN79A]
MIPVLDPQSERARVLRLVERITYGADAGTVSIAEQMGYEAFVEWQLAPEAIDDGPLEDLLRDALPTLSMTPEELARQIFVEQDFGAAQRDLTIATMIRRAFSPRQLYERMVEFWSDHFNVPASGVVGSYYKFLEDRDMVRPLAMTRFVDLLRNSAASPAMLDYLDNATNTAEGPNENYARELMELHTLGVDGGYTEDDVKEVARVFTGWTIRPPAYFAFDPSTHDDGGKTVLGEPVPGEGVAQGRNLLNRLAEHPSTARFIATKLARRFVADLPEQAVIDSVADAFLDSGGDVKTVLRALLLNPQVADTMALKLKRPNEFTAGVLRRLQPDPGVDILGAIYDALNASGQVPFGWPAPDGYPDEREHWQSTTGFLVRFNSAYDWARRLVDGSPLLRAAAEEARISDAATVLIDGLAPAGVTARTRRILIRYANGLPAADRVPSMAAWLLAGPDAQWR